MLGIDAIDPAAMGWHIWLLLLEAPGVLAAVHALFNKRDPRSALVWVVFCVAFPLLGLLLYVVFGRNRVRRVARKLKSHDETGQPPRDVSDWQPLPGVPEYLQPLDRLGMATTHRALKAGNQVVLLADGESAYAAMLSAIHAARKQVLLSTYIFDAVGVGVPFIAALSDAASRGVEVRVLVDGVGEW